MIRVTAKIPGKIMLAGEYAVLYGGDALAVTVDRFMEVSACLHPSQFCLQSNLWQEPVTYTKESPPNQLLTEPLVETALAAAQQLDICGASLEVRSMLKTSFGIGSSSALRLGVLLAMGGLGAEESFFALPPSKTHWELARLAIELQKRHQQAASGYDIVTQLVGGLVRFSPSAMEQNNPSQHGAATLPCSTERLSAFVEFWVGGAGAPSNIVVKNTMNFIESHTMVRRVLDNASTMVEQFFAMCQGGDLASQLQALIQTCRQQREIFAASPYFPAKIFDRLTQIAGFDRSFTVKTTGAGGEDALMLLGDAAAISPARSFLTKLGWQRLEASYTPTGAMVAKEWINDRVPAREGYDDHLET